MINSKESSNISNQFCSRLYEIKSHDYRDIKSRDMMLRILKSHDMNYNGIKKRSMKCHGMKCTNL